MRRYEIWTAAGGKGFAGKPRPVLILQDHRIAHTASITTCGFTSVVFEAEFRPLIIATDTNGLKVNSRLIVDKIMTFDRRCLDQRLGQLENEQAAGVDRAVLLFLGFDA